MNVTKKDCFLHLFLKIQFFCLLDESREVKTPSLDSILSIFITVL